MNPGTMLSIADRTFEQHGQISCGKKLYPGSSGGNTTMADKDTDEDSLNQDGSNGSENEEDSQQVNVDSEIIKSLIKTSERLESGVNELTKRVDKLEQGNVAASPKKTKKKILSDDEAKTYSCNKETKGRVKDAIKASEQAYDMTPKALTKKLVDILFTKEERQVSSRLKLGYWRLQYIREIIMRRFSVTREAEGDLWNQCKISVTKMLLPVPRPPTPSSPPSSSAAANVDNDPIDNDATSSEDETDRKDQQDK